MFTIINTSTKKPLRLTYSNESQGFGYQTYERPEFTLEDESQHNLDQPIYVVCNKEDAIKVLTQKNSGVDNILHPDIIKGWDSVTADPIVYSVVELVPVSK